VPLTGKASRIGERRKRVMPKMKTNKSASKRFRVSGSGRVRRSKSGGNHLLQEKSRKRLRRARKNDMVDGTLQRLIKRLIPYS
jgi:large subunit ribosomal protein L35